MTKTKTRAAVAVEATETKMSKLLAQWHRQSLRTNPNAVEYYPNREEIFALLADFDSKQMLRLAGFLQSVGKIYHADFEMTDAEKQEESARLTAIRNKAQEESAERNMTKTQRAERDRREASQEPKVGLAVYAPDLDADNNYVLFPAHITELPTEEAETFMVKFVDADDAVEVPFVVCASERAHRYETHRVPTDAQCDILDAWYGEAPAVEEVKPVVKGGPKPKAKTEVAAAPKKGPKAKPVASDDEMLSDADLLADDDAPKAATRKAAATKPSTAKAKPAAKTASAKVGGPKKRTA